MRPIRNSAKALIIRQGKILVTKNKDDAGIFYLLPGGGQEVCENLVDTLKRECREEISAEVSVGDIRFIREYIGKNHEFAEWEPDVHQVEYMFECELLSDIEPKSGHVPDEMQIGVEWLALDKLDSCRIYPKQLKEVVGKDGNFKGPVYLGDVN